MPVDAVSLIEYAAKKIRSPRKWTRGAFVRGYLWWTRYCALGALNKVAKAQDARPAVYFEARHLLDCVAIKHGFTHIEQLNDDPGTTHEFLLSAIREAAGNAKN